MRLWFLAALARAVALAVCLVLIIGLHQCTPSPAAQGSGCMPTTGTVSGLTFSQDVNAGLAALISTNSGSSTPVTDCTGVTIKGQFWIDTSVTPNHLRIYDGASWLDLGALDSANHIWTPPVAGGVGSLASSATVDLCSVPQATVTVSGTTAISSFGSTCLPGVVKLVQFTGAVPVTYNATSLILPGGASLTAQVGGWAILTPLSTGNWVVLAWLKADGTPAGTSGLLTTSAAATTYAPLASPALTGAPTAPTQTAGDNSTKIATDAFVLANGGGASTSAFTALWGTQISNQTAQWTANSIIVLNASGASHVLTSYNQSINTAATVGTNTGLDTGSLAASTWYNVYATYGTAGTGILISLSASSPTLPSGYTYFARIGTFYSDGSATVRGFTQRGRNTQYKVGSNLSALPQMASGSTGNAHTPSFGAIGLTNFVPPTASIVRIVEQQTDANDFIMAPNTSYGGFDSVTNPPLCANITGGLEYQCNVLLETYAVYWAYQGGGALLNCTGYEDNL